MTADLMWRCTVCGNERPRRGFANARATILRCPECGLTKHEPLAYVEEAAPISEEAWRRLERMRPSAAVKFLLSLTPADKPEP